MGGNSIQEVKFKKVRWINVPKQTKKSLTQIEQEFDFLPLDIETCLPSIQNPRIHIRGHYLFLILTFPVVEKKTGRVFPSEIDLFITEDTIITIHDNTLPPIKDLFDTLQKEKDKDRTGRYQSYPIEKVLFKILSKCYLYCFPILNKFNETTFEVENHIFSNTMTHTQDTELIRDILLMKRDIGNFRKSLHSHKNVLKRFSTHASDFFDEPKNVQKYFSILIEHTKDLWEVEETHRDTINALYQTHESIISTKLNDIMKTLTIFSVLFLPLTLIASIFGMNIDFIPLTDSPLDFWLILGIMFVISVGLIWLFKKIRWL